MRVYRLLRLPMLAGALMLSACSTKRTDSRPVLSRNILTSAEIDKTNAVSALDAVQSLRPHFLNTRGSQSIQDPTPIQPVVYLDGMRLGPPSTMAMINASSVITIEYISSIEASSRYGLGHQGGAILVTTRRQGQD